MINRVVYAEAALWGATPSLIDSAGPAAHDIAAIADRGRQHPRRQARCRGMNKKKLPKAIRLPDDTGARVSRSIGAAGAEFPEGA